VFSPSSHSCSLTYGRQDLISSQHTEKDHKKQFPGFAGALHHNGGVKDTTREIMAVMYYIVVQIAHSCEIGMLTGDLIPITSSVDRLLRPDQDK